MPGSSACSRLVGPYQKAMGHCFSFVHTETKRGRRKAANPSRWVSGSHRLRHWGHDTTTSYGLASLALNKYFGWITFRSQGGDNSKAITMYCSRNKHEIGMPPGHFEAPTCSAGSLRLTSSVTARQRSMLPLLAACSRRVSSAPVFDDIIKSLTCPDGHRRCGL